MNAAFDKDQAHAWLSNLFADCTGLINIVSTDNWAGKTFTTIDDALIYIRLLDKRQPSGIYARATTLSQVPERRGGIDLSHEFVGFWADLDIAGPGHKHHVCPDTGLCPDEARPGHSINHVPLIPDVEACQAVIEATGLPAPTEWIHSGGGMYAWWLLDQPFLFTSPEQIQATNAISTQWQQVIAAAAAKLGYAYGTGIGDLARVLRIPGTVNRKVPDAPALCEWRMNLSTSQPYRIGRLLNDLQAAASRLTPTPPPPPRRPSPTPAPGISQPGQQPGDAFNEATTWNQLLEADGCTILKQRGSYIEWTRPEKHKSGGNSGTTGYGGADVLKVFSTNWHPLQAGETYTRFGYYAATRHNGDYRAAARQLGAEGFGQKDPNWKPQPIRTDESKSVAPDLKAYLPTRSELTDLGLTDDFADSVQLRPEPPSAAKLSLSYTDSGFANRFQLQHGEDWRYVATRQQWLQWNGSTWAEDTQGRVTNLIDAMAQREYQRADMVELEGDAKEADKLRAAVRPMLSNSKQKGATEILGRRPAIAIHADDLNRHRNLITCANGTYDLDTDTLGPSERGDLATKKLNVTYDSTATAPRWEKFLEGVLPNAEMRDYIQRAAGYTLTGDANRKAIFMLHGPTNTGKSQFIAALTSIFGSFAETAREQTFRVNDTANGPTPGLHKLRDARLVAASESSEGVKLDEALIKRLTGGGDAIQSRALYRDEESWTPQFAIWLATNHLPKFSSDDNAIWKRVKPISFAVQFGAEGGPEEVYDIGVTLAREEGPGILNWLLEGVRKYREVGLVEPAALRQGVTEYRNDTDPVAQFVAAAVADGALSKESEGGVTPMIESRILYAWFTQWCADEGIRWPLSMNRFGRRLTALGYESGRDSSGTRRVWVGLRGMAEVWIGSGHPLRM